MGAVGTLLEAKAELVRARGVIAEQLEVIETPHHGLAFDAGLQSAQLLGFNTAGAICASYRGAVSPAQVFMVEPEPCFGSPLLLSGSAFSPYLQYVLDEFQAAWTICTAVRGAVLRVWDQWLALAVHAIQQTVSVLFHFIANVVTLFCSVSWPKRRWFLFHGARPPKNRVQAALGLFFGACSGPIFAF